MSTQEYEFHLVGSPGRESLQLNVQGHRVGRVRLGSSTDLERTVSRARQELVKRHESRRLRRMLTEWGRWEWAEHQILQSPSCAVPQGWHWKVIARPLTGPSFTVLLHGPEDLVLRYTLSLGKVSRNEALRHVMQAAASMAWRARARDAAADPAPLLGTYTATTAPAGAPLPLELPPGLTVKLSRPKYGVSLSAQLFLRGVRAPVTSCSIAPTGTTTLEWAQAVQKDVDGAIIRHDRQVQQANERALFLAELVEAANADQEACR